jgi:hypothetical protein
VINLPDPRGIIAVAHEELRQRDDIRQPGAEMILQVEHPRLIRPQSRHQRGALGLQSGKLAVRPLELHAARGELVDVGRLHDRAAVAAEIVVHVVDRDEQHVQLAAAAWTKTAVSTNRSGVRNGMRGWTWGIA